MNCVTVLAVVSRIPCFGGTRKFWIFVTTSSNQWPASSLPLSIERDDEFSIFPFFRGNIEQLHRLYGGIETPSFLERGDDYFAIVSSKNGVAGVDSSSLRPWFLGVWWVTLFNYPSRRKFRGLCVLLELHSFSYFLVVEATSTILPSFYDDISLLPGRWRPNHRINQRYRMLH